MTDLRFQPGSIEPLRIDELRPYARNPRTHSDDQVAKLAASLVEFGWTMPILVNDELEVIAGHGRILAARRLGLDAVPVIRLAHLSPEQVRAYRIADNKLALDAGWDEEVLAAEFHELNGAGSPTLGEAASKRVHVIVKVVQQTFTGDLACTAPRL